MVDPKPRKRLHPVRDSLPLKQYTDRPSKSQKTPTILTKRGVVLTTTQIEVSNEEI